MAGTPILTPVERRFVADARRAVLVTIDPAGEPRPVPICHVLADGRAEGEPPILYTPVDEKPKSTADPAALARVRDILARPVVSVLVDRWDEDWSRLAWVRLRGRAELLEPEAPDHAGAVAALRAKYPQYAGHRLEALPVLRITIDRARSWGELEG